MEKLLHIVSQLQIQENYMSREITEVESLSEKISEFADVYKKNCVELLNKCNEIEKLKEEEILLFSKITDREKEFAEAINELEDLQSELHSVSKYECYLDWVGKEPFEYWEVKMKLYGIHIETQYLDSTVFQAKISFATNKFVIFKVDMVQNTYDLLDMEPKLAHFEEIRILLLESGDIAGFLSHAWKFFSHMV